MITLISSTNRKPSVTRKIVALYEKLLLDKSVSSQVVDLADLPIDFLGTALYENSGQNTAFNPVRELMLEAEKYVFVVPEYNGSFPGVLKLFIDGLAYPNTFKGKKCALVGLSSGVQGSALAMSHLTDIFNYAKMHVLAEKPKLLQIDGNLRDGELTNPLYLQLLNEQIDSLIKF